MSHAIRLFDYLVAHFYRHVHSGSRPDHSSGVLVLVFSMLWVFHDKVQVLGKYFSRLALSFLPIKGVLHHSLHAADLRRWSSKRSKLGADDQFRTTFERSTTAPVYPNRV